MMNNVVQRVEPRSLVRALARVGFTFGVATIILSPFAAGHATGRWLLLVSALLSLLFALLATALAFKVGAGAADPLTALAAGVIGLGLWLWIGRGASLVPT